MAKQTCSDTRRCRCCVQDGESGGSEFGTVLKSSPFVDIEQLQVDSLE